jgi:fructose-bisphosphate aldolase, class I
MNTGKLVRMNRIFSHPSGRLCSVAVDHLLGYGAGLPAGLRHIKSTLAAVVAAEPDAVTMHKGIAASAWQPYAGRLPMIIQTTGARPDDTAREQFADPLDAVRLGADAVAVAAFIRGATEGPALRAVADLVREAAAYDMPVICHIYPRDKNKAISFEPEDIAWAVRCAVEVGADVVKTPYCGDIAAYRQIIDDCPVPLVAAGGPKASTLREALEMFAEVVKSGARGATIGRNVWGFEQIGAAVQAFKAVIHDGKTADEVLEQAGLSAMVGGKR